MSKTETITPLRETLVYFIEVSGIEGSIVVASGVDIQDPVLTQECGDEEI
jgi:hypothetical protein